MGRGIVTGVKKILLIEDNPVNRMLIKKILTFHGSEVLEAVDGKEGIEQAEKHLPNLILMDLQLPGISGLDAVKILKENDTTKNIPVVAVSANIRDEDKINAREVGCVGFIEKPINSRNFFDSISKYM